MSIAQEAGEWVVRLRYEDSPQAQAEFDAWVRKGPAYLEEFLLARAVFEDFDRLHGKLRYSAQADGKSVVAFPAGEGEDRVLRPGGRARRTTRLATAAAGVMALTGAIAAGLWLSSARSSYSTPVGGQETVKLEDGSIVYLNTDSRISIRFSQDARRIDLTSGEAFFVVARDADRPFTVDTERAHVQVLGTSFNVRARPRETRIAVMDGAVRVVPPRGAAVQLMAGDEAQVTDVAAVKVPAADVHKAVAWRNRKLIFVDARVDEIAAEFNRYNTRKIRIVGEALRSRPMGGTFDADDPAPLIRYFSQEPGVVVRQLNREIVIEPAGL